MNLYDDPSTARSEHNKNVETSEHIYDNYDISQKSTETKETDLSNFKDTNIKIENKTDDKPKVSNEKKKYFVLVLAFLLTFFTVVGSYGLILKITFDNPQEKQISEMIARINDQKKTINKLEAQQNQNINYIDKIKGIQQNCSTQGIFSRRNDVSRAGYTSSGVYYITVPGITNPVQVYCDQNYGGSWLVFQRRINGNVDFNQNWTNYQNGFGDLNGNFWLGLDLLHAITESKSYQLRVDLEDWEGNTAYAVYKNFSVGNSQSNYTLTVSGYSGNAGDSLSYHNKQQFSTKGRDNNQWTSYCSRTYHGGWWYRNCYHCYCYDSYLNGEYLRNGQNNWIGVVWLDWKYNAYSMKRAEMKIKPN